MFRHTFTALCALSLVGCLLIILAWIYSTRRFQSVLFQRQVRTEQRYRYQTFRIASGQGLGFGFAIDDTTDPELMRFYRKMPVGPFVVYTSKPRITQQVGPAPMKWWQQLGFDWIVHPKPTIGKSPFVYGRTLRVPHAFVTGLFALLPLAWVVRIWRRLRQLQMQGRCANCGYDLRATPDRCPECGTEPTAAQRKAQGTGPGL